MDIEKDYLNAYCDIKKKYPITPNAVSEVSFHLNDLHRDLSLVTYNFLLAGVIFLAEHGHDDYIRKIATIAWRELDFDPTIGVVIERDLVEYALSKGYSPAEAYLKFGRNDNLRIMAQEKKAWPYVFVDPYPIMTADFIVRAKKDPSAIAETAGLCSKIRDIVEGKYLDDWTNITPRANATIAHVLREIKRKHPGIKFSPDHRRLLKLFPKGMESLPLAMQFSAGHYLDTPKVDIEKTPFYAESFYPYN